MPGSLYIHIPFCIKKCIYCDFASGTYDHDKAALYIQALKKELGSISIENELDTVYIGGGTPTLLSYSLLSELTGFLFKEFRFSDNYEATIEANPGTVDKDKLIMLHDSGINRISIGVQSFNNDELRFLGRIHSAEEAVSAVIQARDAGYDNIGIDLIYGIPGQSLSGWKETLEKAVSLKPDHISAYELTLETGTELHRMLSAITPSGGTASQRGDIVLPNEDQIIDMYNDTIDYLKSACFDHYEISNHAKPGKYSRHNMTYWDRNEYYGAGLGAHSFIGNQRFFNTDDLDEYINSIDSNGSALSGSEHISPEKAISETIFLGLRKTGGINLDAFQRSFGLDLLVNYAKEIEELKAAGLISIGEKASFIRLTRKGLVLSNEVFTRFM